MERRSSVPLLDTNKETSNGNKTEGTEYIPARCRITKPNPPKPAQNPLQFVKVGPCDLYRSAQEQLKKVEVIKKIKQEFKEDGEDWQANLDNWKSSRRKRQEHIIERVVEIRNMEQDGDKARRRSKTFSEMLEDRNSRRRKLSNLAVYASGEDDNDLSDLGISTRKSSISGESSLDDTTSNKDSSEMNITNGNSETTNGTTNNNKEEYTYESAIQDYKSRVKRRSFHNITDYPLETKCEDRRFSLYSLKNEDIPPLKPDVPKVDISERKQLFESGTKSTAKSNHLPDELSQSKSIKERLKHLEKCTEESLNIKKATKLLTGDIMTVRDRLSNLVSHTTTPMYHCQSLDSLDQASRITDRKIGQSLEGLDYSGSELDREDSGIQTADVSCSVSQADDPDDDSDTNKMDIPLAEDDDISPTAKSSDTSSIVEELITCTINLDLTRNKIVFDENDLTDPFLAPPKSVEPPKEKPPPPPIEESELKRFNSTKRIKNEIRSKRSSFLGIEGSDDFDLYEVTKPQDAVKILQEELKLEKEMYRQHHAATSSSGSMDVESRDSGVELETIPKDEEEIAKREREIIENLEKEEQWRYDEPKKEEFSYDDDEDVIRVERELLELEQEELERQREDLLYQNRKAKLLDANRNSVPATLPDVYIRNQTSRVYNNYPNYYSQNPGYSKMKTFEPNNNTTVMSRHTLHALSAAPKSKLITTDSWIQSQPVPPKLMNTTRMDYNQHWLIQEAEERRLSQANRNHFDRRPTVPIRKDLPVPRGAPIVPPPVAVRPNRAPTATPSTSSPDLHDQMLSVSGKKKCSHCGDELGRGAAMIIESLHLFYHMDCFKCCVCHVQLGDGLMGTDVRVRNHKLHCHNCYSSDDGVKFSCV